MTLTYGGATLSGTPEEFAALFRALPAATIVGLRDGLLQAVRDGKAAVVDGIDRFGLHDPLPPAVDGAREVLEGRT